MNRKKIIAITMAAGVLLAPSMSKAEIANAETVKGNEKTAVNNVNENDENSIYLSNIDYISNKSSAGWGSITKDANLNGQKIKLKVDGIELEFDKGITAHAPSKLVYDISDYSSEYTKLSTFAGVDASQGGYGNGVIARIYTSQDGENWELKDESDVLKGDTNCKYFNLDITGVNFIKLEMDDNGGNGNDHSSFGDLRLVKADYDMSQEGYNGFKTINQYDAELSKHSVEENYTNNFKMVLEREFVNRVGYLSIKNATKDYENVKVALDWLLEDEDALKLFIEAGDYLHGTGYNAIVALGDLYEEFSYCLDDTENGQVYKKMMIATSVAFSKPIKQWIIEWGGNAVPTDPVVRFQAFKELYDEGKFLRPEEFKNYSMELMRYVMDIRTDDDEIKWLRYYTEDEEPENLNRRLDPYTFMEYKSPHYGNDEYQSEENREKWDTKYSLSKYGVKGYGEGYSKQWIAMEDGGICWGISGLGDAINSVHGVATVNVFQPGHEAYLVYYTDALGRNAWKIYNDVGGWAQSYSSWGGKKSSEARLLLGWGNKSYSVNNKNNSTYILLAQTALNNLEACQKSQYYNMIANSYPAGSQERIDTYNKALDVLDINLDSFDGLIECYEATGKSSSEWRALAERIIDAYTFFPVPMVEAINRITPHLSDPTDLATVNTLKTNALYRAKDAQDADVIEARGCREIARSLLGESTVDLASFSFDGEHANQIRLNESYDGSVLRVRYSLDGGQTWEQTGEHVITLTQEQVDSITAENNIIVGLVGTDATFTIDIQDAPEITDSTIYKNDLEDLLIGNTEYLEYKVEGTDEWKDYTSGLDSEDRFTGDTTIKVRYKAHGLYLQGAEKEYTFTQAPDNAEQTYLQLKNVRVHSFSSQNSTDTHAAEFFINGTPNSGWHTTFKGEEDKYYSVAFDKIRYISRLDYVSGGGFNGAPKTLEVYSSLDGENWDLAKTFTDIPRNHDIKELVLDESVEAKYIKLVATETYGNTDGEQNKYFSGVMLNFYEDTTKQYQDTADIGYSTLRPTNGNVIATLVLPEGCTAEVTEYEFTENGSYDFKFINSNGDEQTITATVTWIDKEAPTATVSYDVTTDTNGNVTAKLTGISEDATIINNNGSDTFVFEDNGKFIFEIQDEAGNLTQIEAVVDWIDRIAPIVSIEYSTNEDTTGSVTATVVGLEDGEYVVNNNGSADVVFTENGSFEFVVSDKAGNQTTITAKVDWIKDSVDTTPNKPNKPNKPNNGNGNANGHNKPNNGNGNANGHNKPNNGNANGHNKPNNGNGNANGHKKSETADLGSTNGLLSVNVLSNNLLATGESVEVTPVTDNEADTVEVIDDNQAEGITATSDNIESEHDIVYYKDVDNAGVADEATESSETSSWLKWVLIGAGSLSVLLLLVFLAMKFIF